MSASSSIPPSDPHHAAAADYGDYTTYRFDDIDEMSDYESTGGPPPPPPEDDYEAQLNPESTYNNTATATTNLVDEVPKDDLNLTRNTEDEDAEENSVEIPPTKVVEDMMRKERRAAEKGPQKKLFLGGVACLLISLAVILGAGFGTGTFSVGKSTNNRANAAVYEPNPIPGDPTEEDGSNNSGTTGEGDARPEGPADITGSALGMAMREYLSGVSLKGADAFSDLSSPESLALQWLVLEDPLQLDPETEDQQFQINQRYALMSLWFNSDYTWANETNWMDQDECSWYGITCMALDAGETQVQVISRINLEGNNVQGNIPPDLALLEFLTSINLADNILEGALPDTLTGLISLEELLLDRNLFTMDLSTFDFSAFTNMVWLDLAQNNFYGNLPDSLYQMTSIEMLILDNNQLTGSISENIANLQNLGELKKRKEKKTL